MIIFFFYKPEFSLIDFYSKVRLGQRRKHGVLKFQSEISKLYEKKKKV